MYESLNICRISFFIAAEAAAKFPSELFVPHVINPLKMKGFPLIFIRHVKILPNIQNFERNLYLQRRKQECM
jgi:hypothetical protein